MNRWSPLGQVAEIALVVLVLLCAGAEYRALYSAAGSALSAFDTRGGNTVRIPATLGQP